MLLFLIGLELTNCRGGVQISGARGADRAAHSLGLLGWQRRLEARSPHKSSTTR
jgi:hypothetical protein